MFFRWPWDGAATLLGPSGRPLATSPAVQGAARGYGGGGAQTAAQGRKGCRRAERAGNQHHARLARYMDRAARWLQHTAPATTPGRSRRSGLRWRRPGGRGHAARRATGSGTRRWGVAPREAAASPHGGAERNRPPAPPPPFRSNGPPAPAHGGPTTTATAGPHCELDGAPKTAASSAGSNTRRKPAPLRRTWRPPAAGLRRAAESGAVARRPHRAKRHRRWASEPQQIPSAGTWIWVLDQRGADMADLPGGASGVADARLQGQGSRSAGPARCLACGATTSGRSRFRSIRGRVRHFSARQTPQITAQYRGLKII